MKVAITDYQTLPEGKTWLHHSWSGDLLGAAFYYMPKGVQPDVLSFWGPRPERRRPERLLLHRPRRRRSPALAHAFINFMLDEKNAYDNFVKFIGYTPPQNTIDADSLVKQGLIPKSLAAAVVRPDQFAANQELLAAERRGRAALGGRLVEVQGRADAVALDVAPARAARASSGSRSSSWSRSTRCSASRSATRTRSRAGAVLESARLERRLPARHAAQHLARRAVPHGLRAHDRLRRHRDRRSRSLIGYPVAYYAARHAGRWKGAGAARCWSCRSGSTT